MKINPGLNNVVPNYIYNQQSTINRQPYLMLDCVFDQPSTLPHQLNLMLSFIVEKLEIFFGLNI